MLLDAELSEEERKSRAISVCLQSELECSQGWHIPPTSESLICIGHLGSGPRFAYLQRRDQHAKVNSGTIESRTSSKSIKGQPKWFLTPRT